MTTTMSGQMSQTLKNVVGIAGSSVADYCLDLRHMCVPGPPLESCSRNEPLPPVPSGENTGHFLRLSPQVSLPEDVEDTIQYG